MRDIKRSKAPDQINKEVKDGLASLASGPGSTKDALQVSENLLTVVGISPGRYPESMKSAAAAIHITDSLEKLLTLAGSADKRISQDAFRAASQLVALVRDEFRALGTKQTRSTSPISLNLESGEPVTIKQFLEAHTDTVGRSKIWSHPNMQLSRSGDDASPYSLVRLLNSQIPVSGQQISGLRKFLTSYGPQTWNQAEGKENLTSFAELVSKKDQNQK